MHCGSDVRFRGQVELTISRDDLADSRVVVAEQSNRIVGVAQVTIEIHDADLAKFFVEPGSLRQGVGPLLFAWVREASREGGAKRLVIESDPGAVPFYIRMGAVDAGHAPSGSIPGRILPRLEFDLR